jgi:DnaK suppressor protein
LKSGEQNLAGLVQKRDAFPMSKDLSEAELGALRDLIEDALARLDASDAQNTDATNTVMLDQTTVGRLSRMDALQGQAMAKATVARRRTERAALRAALRRLAEDEYGWCDQCGEPIGRPRLERNLTATRCIGCA